MRRYSFLKKETVYDAFNRVRDSFLAAKDGREVDSVTDAILTSDEKLRLGRRVQIAGLLAQETPYREIKRQLKVGIETISQVEKKLSGNAEGFQIIFRRRGKVESDFRKKAYVKVGSKRVFKWKEYTGFKRKDVAR